MAFSSKIQGHHHLQGNVQVYTVRIPASPNQTIRENDRGRRAGLPLRVAGQLAPEAPGGHGGAERRPGATSRRGSSQLGCLHMIYVLHACMHELRCVIRNITLHAYMHAIRYITLHACILTRVNLPQCLPLKAPGVSFVCK